MTSVHNLADTEASILEIRPVAAVIAEISTPGIDEQSDNQLFARRSEKKVTPEVLSHSNLCMFIFWHDYVQ